MLYESHSTATFVIQHLQMKFSHSMDIMCCMSNKALGVGSYNTRLRLVLYGPLDPTLCAALLSML